MSTNCSWGVYRMGDDKFTPNRVALLRSDLDNALGAELAGKTLTLKNYTVHFNRALEMRSQLALQQSTSLLSALISAALNDTSVHGCGTEDLKGSYFAHEVKASFSPLVVVIDVAIDNKLFHVRWVESSPIAIPIPDESSAVWNAWVTRVLFTSTMKLVDTIKAAAPAPAPLPIATMQQRALL